MQPEDSRAAGEPDAQAALGPPPPVRWYARRHVRLGALLGLLAAALIALLATRGGLLDLGGGAANAIGAFSAGCPANGAPEPVSVAARDIAGLRDGLLAIVPARVGRVYSEGTVTTSNLWSDNYPVAPPASPTHPVPAGYEIRWWALDRDGREDDVAADVLEFASERQADEVLTRAASARCRQHGQAHGASLPVGTHSLFWVNPDGAMQWDALFARGRRVYRVGDVPPNYLLFTTGPEQSRLERMRVRVTPAVLACKLPGADCPGSSASSDTNLATLAGASARTSSRPPTLARAAAYAQAVNLHGYDVPRMAQLAPGGPVGSRDVWEAFASCTAQPRTTRAIATLQSPLFGDRARGRYGEVHSTVALLPSEALASRYIAGLAGARAQACIASGYGHALRRRAGRRHRLHFGQVTLTRLPTPVPSSYRGATTYRAVALRAAVQTRFTTRTGRPVSLPLYADGFAFAYGPAVIELSAVTYLQPLPDANERFLTSVLVGRAQVNPLR